MAEDKPHISVVIAGHVDAGKSTTTGHLLYKLGSFDKRTKEKLDEEAARLQRSSFSWAFFTDTSPEERARGVTQNCNTKPFETEKYHYSIVDAPGHKDYIKNMISGSSQCDVAILLVPADGFIQAIRKANRKENQVSGQTREHARILAQLGVKQLIIGINKMDAVEWKEEKYNEIVSEMKRMLVSVGWPKMFVEKSVPFIPFSGFKGDNLLEPSDLMPWYKGCELMFRPEAKGEKGRQVKVVTLLNCLNDMVVVPPRNVDKNVRVPISGIYNIKGVGDVVTGRVEQGSIKPTDLVKFVPTDAPGTPCEARIFSIEMHHKSQPVARTGDNCGFNLKGMDKSNMPRVGDVMVLKTDNSLKRCKQFTAQVQILDHPGELKVGYSPVVYVRTAKSACKITQIKWRSGKETNNEKVENPEHLKAFDAAEIVMQPLGPLAVESFDQCEGLSRLAAMDGNSAVMLMKVIEWQ